MSLNVVDLTKQLVAMPSVSRNSNVAIADFLQGLLDAAGWQLERTSYLDPNGVTKINLVAKLGTGTGGLAFCSHMDTVPGQEQDWPAFTPVIKDEKLYARGSCDMKGPIAATLVAAFSIDPAQLKKPLYIVLTADEEIGLVGARKLVAASEILQRDRPDYGIIAEPTSMRPVYSHKGYGVVTASATGLAAHSSSGQGVSALFKVVPFLADMMALDARLQSDPAYQNSIYTPPHHTLNLTVDSGEAALNVTAPYTKVMVGIRSMPAAQSEAVLAEIVASAQKHGLETTQAYLGALFSPLACTLVQLAAELTGATPETAAYATDGAHLGDLIAQLVVLGPGDIGVAHTVGEFVPVAELHQAVSLYTTMIERLCL